MTLKWVPLLLTILIHLSSNSALPMLEKSEDHDSIIKLPGPGIPGLPDLSNVTFPPVRHILHHKTTLDIPYSIVYLTE